MLCARPPAQAPFSSPKAARPALHSRTRAHCTAGARPSHDVQLRLPPWRSLRLMYGVELEVCLPRWRLVNTPIQFLHPPGWQVVEDGSIECDSEACESIMVHQRYSGAFEVEFKSGQLKGQAGLASIKRMCRSLQHYGATVNKTTGLHVHVSVLGGYKLEHLQRICTNFILFEEAFDALVPPSRRKNKNGFCRSLVKIPDKAQHIAMIQRAATKEELVNIVNRDHGRHHKVNLHALAKHGTLEFRQPGGSTDSAEVCMFVVLFIMFIHRSQEHVAPAGSPGAHTRRRVRELAHFVAPSNPALREALDQQQQKLRIRRARRA